MGRKLADVTRTIKNLKKIKRDMKKDNVKIH